MNASLADGILVFISDLQTKRQEEQVLSNEKPYPCGHTILRIEGTGIGEVPVKSLVSQLGIRCELLEDKLCS